MRSPISFATVSLAASAAAQATSGDVLDGVPILDVSATSPLNLSDVPANTLSRFWLRPGTSQGNINYFLPVFIARGTEDSLESGRKLSLSASIHGDELNGIPVVHRVFQSLNESGIVESGSFNGTIIGVPQLNPNGNYLNGRNFYTPGGSGFLTNLNRIMPGADDPLDATLTNSYAGNIWYGLWGNGTNVDIAVDFHTLSTGRDGPLWAYADYRTDGVQELVELAFPDIIKIDPGEPGSVETTFVDNGIPAITLEIGPAKRWNSDLIDRSEIFVYRLLADLGIVAQNESISLGAQEGDLSATYKATNISTVSVTTAGFVNMTVAVLDEVEEGQEVGTVYGWFGDVVETLTATVAGRVLTVQYDPAVERGVGVLDIVYNATDSGAESNSRRRKRSVAAHRGQIF